MAEPQAPICTAHIRRLLCRLACWLAAGAIASACYAPKEGSGTTYVDPENPGNTDVINTVATPNPGASTSPGNQNAPASGPSPTPSPTGQVNFCPLTVNLPANDMNTPWAMNIVSLSNCYICLDTLSLAQGYTIGGVACNDAQARQYWHFGSGQIFAENDKSICMGVSTIAVVTKACSNGTNISWRYDRGMLVNTSTTTCLELRPNRQDLYANPTCDPNNPNQRFALAHVKLTELVDNTGAPATQNDTRVTHGMVIENANDYACLESSAPDNANHIQLATHTCNGTPHQQWVVNGNQLLQNNLCLTAISGDGSNFFLQTCTDTANAIWHFDGGVLSNPAIANSCLESIGSTVTREPCNNVATQNWYLGGN